MELQFNKSNQPAMFLTNADNEGVFVTDRKTFFELVSLAGIDKVEILCPKAGWEFLQNSIEEWSGEKITDDGENEQELLEAWWEYFEGSTGS